MHRPATVAEAVALLDGATPLAGGTWVMRDPAGARRSGRAHVVLRGIPGLADVQVAVDGARIGALATHAAIGRALAGDGPGPLAAVGAAARSSAFPAIRNVATLGGNIAAAPFPEADLLPALLAAEARVELHTAAGATTLPLAELLADRPGLLAGALITAVEVPAPPRRCATYGRQTVRGGGEYALASLAVSVDFGPDGAVAAARVAVGAVEALARRVPAAEAVLAGRRPGAVPAREVAEALRGDLVPREGTDIPGWYRVAVLEHLVSCALTDLTGG